MAIESRRETYEQNWGELRDIIRRHVAAGERSMSRVLRLTEAEWRGTSDAGRKIRPTRGISLGKVVEMPRAALHGARQALRMRVLADLCRPETGAVIELGAGWGNNLADLYLNGGPIEAMYHALEFTEAGRECAKLLAELEPGFHLSTAPFDYREPAYDIINSYSVHTLVFTSHSIETIPHLNEEAILGLRRLGRGVTCCHFEPIGWQIRQNDTGAGATRDYAVEHGYNENLWSLLQSLEARKLITIKQALPDVLHHKTYNASALVIWESGAA